MTAVSAVSNPPGSRPLGKFGRRKFDKQPSQHAPVLIAAPFGDDIPRSAIARARELSGGGAVAVVNVARIYGSQLGLPNPGLMPTRKEIDEQKGYVNKAIRAIEKQGLEAWGQVAASRKPAKTISQVAESRGSTHVIVIRPEQSGWRAVVEGDIAKDIARKLGGTVAVETISPEPK